MAKEIVAVHHTEDGRRATLSSNDITIHALERYRDHIVEEGNKGDWERDELWMIPEMIKNIQNQRD